MLSQLPVMSRSPLFGRVLPSDDQKTKSQQNAIHSVVHDTKAAMPTVLREKIFSAASLVYGREHAEEITRKVQEIVDNIRKSRPPELLKDDFARPADWFKKESVYMFYADRMGTKNNQPTTFKTLIPTLGYLKKLGVTTLYILPFLKSPMKDAGFDVSDYKHVRDDLGGDKEFEEFAAAARNQGFKLKADLVLNHVSEEHPWFKAAVKGDSEKLDYFIHTDVPPRATVKDTKKGGKKVIYQEDCGINTKRYLSFSEMYESQYRKVSVNGKDRYFYHTWTPHQLDLNWRNPKVLYEALDIMGHWSNKGIDIFRLDALAYFVKNVGTTGTNSPQTHAITQILSAALQAMSPRSIMWSEVCDSIKNTQPYYGTEQKYKLNIPSQGVKELVRTDKVQMGYNFSIMSALWSTLMSGKPKTFWKVMEKTPRYPRSTTTGNFLRIHDEVPLRGLTNIEERKTVFNAMLKNGVMAKKDEGVAGRLASFLDGSPTRINQANSILYSLPGVPIMYFGDEIAAKNNPEFMKQVSLLRQPTEPGQTATKGVVDPRDVHRAPLAYEDLMHAVDNPQSEEGQVYNHVKKLIQLRKDEPILEKGELDRVYNNNEKIFSFFRTHQGKQLLSVYNLSDEEVKTRLKVPSYGPILHEAGNHLHDLLSDKEIPIKRIHNGTEIELTLKPYESFWLKALPRPRL
jgi:maltose alpha-D-glucosyltransferase / alpha-amylase